MTSDINHLPYKTQKGFTDLSSDSKIEFLQKYVTEFGIGARFEFYKISEMALNVLLPFSSRHLCETTFSALTLIKSKYRSKLKNVENVSRPAESNIAPKLNLLSSKNQAHSSH